MNVWPVLAVNAEMIWVEATFLRRRSAERYVARYEAIAFGQDGRTLFVGSKNPLVR